MSEAWTNTEVDHIISDYFLMLALELSGKAFNKTGHRKNLKSHLNNRSDGSIEFKHQNISAVLIKLGLPFIIGYKPKWNFQHILEDRIRNFIVSQKTLLEPKFIEFADLVVLSRPDISFDTILDAPPVMQSLFLEKEREYNRKPIKINYLEREQRNLHLGSMGEKLVLDFERWRLINTGKSELAEKVEWISENDDGAGFDILSKNENGTDRYIEVKTTKLSKETPIFFSKNEYEFSQEKREQFYLYRVFNFQQAPKIFNVNGCFDEFCRKEAINYRGTF